jgi:hypothetical protein
MSVTLKLPSRDLDLEGPGRLAAAGLPIAPGVFMILAPRERIPGSYRILDTAGPCARHPAG